MRFLTLAISLCAASVGLFADTAQKNLEDATAVFNEIMATPDKGIPQDLLDKAHCVVIVPGLKQAAFGIGGKYGRGFASCRKQNGTGWGAPAAIRVEGGSFGFQIGASSNDVVMLVMNERGMRKLEESKFTLGADATVAAGPVGRTAAANTDAYMTAEILSWSRSKGLFAGIALTGATLRPDKDENRELYGRNVTNQEILSGSIASPAAASSLIAALDKYSMHEQGVSSADRSADTSSSADRKAKKKEKKNKKNGDTTNQQ